MTERTTHRLSKPFTMRNYKAKQEPIIIGYWNRFPFTVHKFLRKIVTWGKGYDYVRAPQ